MCFAFNFHRMAIATGNSLILKPSERDPGAAMIIAELAEMAGVSMHAEYFHCDAHHNVQGCRKVFFLSCTAA